MILRSAHKVDLYVLYGSQNKQPLISYTALTDQIYNRNGSIYCAVRSESTYVSFSFLLWFKGLNRSVPCPYSGTHVPVWEPPNGFQFSLIMVNVTKIMTRIWDGTTIRLRITAKTGTVTLANEYTSKPVQQNQYRITCVLVGYVVTSPGSRFPTFRKIENRIPSDAVSYPRKTESSYGQLFASWHFEGIPNKLIR